MAREQKIELIFLKEKNKNEFDAYLVVVIMGDVVDVVVGCLYAMDTVAVDIAAVATDDAC